MVGDDIRAAVRRHTVGVTVVLSLVGYLLVIGTFLGWFDAFYPTLTENQADLLAHAIAVVNSLALLSLIAGVYFIANRDIKRHRLAMLTAFVLILIFLVIYLARVGGFGEKEIIAPTVATTVYRAMLGIHILLSIVAVPVVIYVIVLGMTHSPSELATTRKAQIGRIAAGAWIISLFLGIVTYVMLNHLYESEIREAILLFGVFSPISPLAGLRDRIAGAGRWVKMRLE